MKTIIAMALVVLAAGCGGSKIAGSKETLRAQAAKEPTCAGAEAKVVYYGLRGADIKAESTCFGPTADKLAVVECGTQRRAYWGFGDRWEVRPGEVTAVEADHVEITLPSGVENSSGSVEGVARCGR